MAPFGDDPVPVGAVGSAGAGGDGGDDRDVLGERGRGRLRRGRRERVRRGRFPSVPAAAGPPPVRAVRGGVRSSRVTPGEESVEDDEGVHQQCAGGGVGGEQDPVTGGDLAPAPDRERQGQEPPVAEPVPAPGVRGDRDDPAVLADPQPGARWPAEVGRPCSGTPPASFSDPFFSAKDLNRAAAWSNIIALFVAISGAASSVWGIWRPSSGTESAERKWPTGSYRQNSIAGRCAINVLGSGNKITADGGIDGGR